MSVVDAARFREVLGRLPTGVTVVTALDGHDPVGMTVGSCTSLSLAPPQVLFCATQESATWQRVRAIGRCCVNVLAEDQEALARAFAARGDDKFAGIGWSVSPGGSPLLDGVLASVDLELDHIVPSGDHDIAIGGVVHLEVRRDAGPLVFFRGGFSGLGR